MVTRDLFFDGYLLRELIKQCKEDFSEENFKLLSFCLRDSFVYVPVHTYVLFDGEWMLVNHEMIEDIHDEKIELVPATVSAKNRSCVAVFSDIDEINEEQFRRCKIVKYHFMDVVCWAIDNEEADGIVVVPCSNYYIVAKELFGMFYEMDSKVIEDIDRS